MCVLESKTPVSSPIKTEKLPPDSPFYNVVNSPPSTAPASTDTPIDSHIPGFEENTFPDDIWSGQVPEIDLNQFLRNLIEL